MLLPAGHVRVAADLGRARIRLAPACAPFRSRHIGDACHLQRGSKASLTCAQKFTGTACLQDRGQPVQSRCWFVTWLAGVHSRSRLRAWGSADSRIAPRRVPRVRAVDAVARDRNGLRLRSTSRWNSAHPRPLRRRWSKRGCRYSLSRNFIITSSFSSGFIRPCKRPSLRSGKISFDSVS